MTDGHLYPRRIQIEYKRDVQPNGKVAAPGIALPYVAPHPSPQYVTLPSDIAQPTPARRQGPEWWHIKEAAYGNFWCRTGLEHVEPFILPSENTRSNTDAATLKEIRDFNAELYRFYMTDVLPTYYRYTGNWRAFHDKAGPIYVNAKQYHGILRRRLQRAKSNSVHNKRIVRKKYMHESRHKHATKRLRNAHGRFVSKLKTETPISIPDAASVTSTEGSEKTVEQQISLQVL